MSDNKVLQSGTVTPGHVAIWTTDGVVEDGGTSAESNLTSLGITAAGDTSFAINDATVIGPYSAFSLGINPTNGALISVNSFNGAPLLGLHFRINGNLSNLFINPDGTASVPAGGPFLPLAGGAMSGALSLFGNATQPLHAVPLQQLNAATAGGPFLPLTGGTVSGATTFGNTLSVTGQLNVGSTISLGTAVAANGNAIISTPNGSHILLNPQGTAHVKIGGGSGPVDFGAAVQTATIVGSALSPATTNGWQQNAALSGNNATASIIGFNQWNVSSDTLAKTSNILFNTVINHNFGGGAYTGSRGGLLVNMVQTGAAPGSTGAGGLEGIQSSVALTNTWGGTNLAGGALGAAAAYNSYLKATSGFINGQGGSGMEIDIEMQTGSSFRGVYGLLIAQTSAHAVAGVVGDVAVGIGNQNGATAGWYGGIYIGGPQWPMRSDSTLFLAALSDTGGGPAVTASQGIDIQQVAFSGTAFRSNNFSVDGPTGNIRTGTLFINNSSAGGSVDASGSVATAVAIASGGSSWPTDGNPYYASDANNGTYSLIIAGGVVTGVTMINAPVVPGSPPANPVTLTPNKRAAAWGATGLTVNFTWSARTALSLQPSGGATTFGGPVTAPSYSTPGNTITLSGSVIPTRLGNFGANWAGTSTITGNTTLAAVAIGNSSDTASIAAGGARNELLIGGNYGGTAYSGSRAGMFAQMNWNTASPNANTSDAVACYGGVVVASVNAGGVTTGFGVTQFGKGQLFGANPWARLASGATFFNSVVGEEVDFSLATGSSSAALVGLQVVLTSDHQVKAAAVSSGIILAAQVGAAANLDAGYVLGSIASQWPIDANSGYVFRTSYSQNTVDPHCAGGIDLLHLIPDGTGGKYGRGFSYRGPGTVAASAMDATGAWKIGTGYISGVSGGLSVDASLYTLTGTPTVAAGGSGYTNLDKVTDGSGNLFSCTVSGGAVTAVSVLQRAEGQITNLTGTVSTNAVSRSGSGLGSGLTLNETWAQATTLSLQPSGGTVQVGTGCIAANSSVATVLGSVGPVGSHTTVQEWFAIKNASGVTRYIPAF